MTNRICLALASAAMLVACGGDSTMPSRQVDAEAAAQTFFQLADSVARSGGNTEVGNAYAAIGWVLRTGGRITPITLTIDGANTSFLAAAMSIESVTNPCPPNAQCFAPEMRLVQRSLIAWDREKPTRIVQLSSSSNDERIGTIGDSTSLALWAPMASLIYMDGTGATLYGTSGEQSFSVAKSLTPCPDGHYIDYSRAARLPAPHQVMTAGTAGMLRTRDYTSSCALADITVKFNGKVDTPWLVAANSTVTTHTIVMGSQTVAGTHQETSVIGCDTTCNVPTPTPPVIVGPNTDLPASLTASKDSLVHLVFTVRNPSGAPIHITFPSSQRFDIVAVDSTTGQNVWTWSANQTFLAAVQEETVPGNGALVYRVSWKPPGPGRYLFHSTLASTATRAEAYTTVVVP
jgi:hypothetical protein